MILHHFCRRRAIPESFGDLLCESAQVLRVLLGHCRSRGTPFGGWTLEGALRLDCGSQKRSSEAPMAGSSIRKRILSMWKQGNPEDVQTIIAALRDA